MCKKTSSQPRVSEIVLSAIATLEDHKRSSLRAIKKYIEANYNVDLDQQTSSIKFLKDAVAKKTLVQAMDSGKFMLVKAKKRKSKKSHQVADKPAEAEEAAEVPVANKAVKKAAKKKDKAVKKKKSVKKAEVPADAAEAAEVDGQPKTSKVKKAKAERPLKGIECSFSESVIFRNRFRKRRAPSEVPLRTKIFRCVTKYILFNPE